MATVIDEFFVTLGLDPKAFTDGQKVVADKLRKIEQQSGSVAKNIEKDNKKTEESLMGLVKTFAALEVAFRAFEGVKRFTEQTTAANLSAGRLSDIIGLSTEDIGLWQQMLLRTGGTAEEMTEQLRKLTAEAEGFATGLNPQPMLDRITKLNIGLSQLGMGKDQINLSEFGNKLTTDEQRLMMFSKAFEALKNAAGGNMGRVFHIGEEAGFSDNMIRLLTEGPAGIAKMKAELAKFGAPSSEDKESAKARNEAFLNLSQTLDRLTNSIIDGVTPVLVPALKHLTEVLLAIGEYYGVKFNNAQAGTIPSSVHRDGGSAPVNGSFLESVKQREGFEPVAKPDMGGVLTVGYGHTKGVYPGQIVTKEQAEAMLIDDLTEVYHEIKEKLGDTKITDNQMRAIMDYRFNHGFSEDIINKLKAGDIQGAADSLLKSATVHGVPVGGLKDRQEADRKLFLTPDKPPTVLSEPSIPPLIEDEEPWAMRLLRSFRKGVDDLPEAIGKAINPSWVAPKPLEPIGAPPTPLSSLDPSLRTGANASLAAWQNSITHNVANNTNSAETNVGQIIVQTQATDATGVAQGLNEAMNRYSVSGQVNRTVA